MNTDDSVKLITLCAAIANGGNANAFREYAVGSCIQDINNGAWNNKLINVQEAYKYVAKLYDAQYQNPLKGSVDAKPGIEMIKGQILSKIKNLRVPQDEHRTIKYAKKRYQFANNSIKNKFGIEVDDVIVYCIILGGLISTDFGLKYPSTTNETAFFDNVDHTLGSDLPFPQEHYIKSYSESTVYNRKVLESMITMYFSAINTEELTKFYLSLKNQVDPANESKLFDFVKPLKKVTIITDLLTLDLDSINNMDNIIYYNPLRYNPLIKLENIILIPVPYLLADIPNILCRHLAKESIPKGHFRSQSGTAFSKLLQTELKYLCGKNNVLNEIIIEEKKGQPLGDIDVCVKWRNKVAVIECKSVNIIKECLTNIEVLANFLNEYIEKGYTQVKLSYDTIKNNPNLIDLNEDDFELYPIIVTEVPITVLNPDMFNNDYLSTFMDADFPVYVVDIHSLIAILNKCYDGEEFMNFLKWRLSMIKFNETPLIVYIETDSFVYFRLYGEEYANRTTNIRTVNYLGNINRIDNTVNYGDKFLGKTRLR